MTDFDYKKYSLENLSKWIEDAMTSADATPQEIYDTIREVVSENYYHHKHHASRAYELMEKLNGDSPLFNIDPKGNNVDDLIENPWDNMSLSSAYGNLQTSSLICDKDDKSPECQKSWNDFWEENYYLEETSQYDEEMLNSMCYKSEIDDQKRREYNLREAEYYNKRAELDIKETSETVTSGASVSPKKDKVVRWQLPVGVDGLTGDCYVNLPDDLLEAASLKEGDTIRWIDCGNGSFKLTKVTKPIKMEDC